MSTASTSKSQGRVHQMSREEADALRREARRIVDAEVVAGSEAGRTPPPANPIARAALAVVNAGRAVGRGVSRVVGAVADNREQVLLASKAGAAMVARWGYEAAMEAIRAEVRRKVTGAFSGGSDKSKN